MYLTALRMSVPCLIKTFKELFSLNCIFLINFNLSRLNQLYNLRVYRVIQNGKEIRKIIIMYFKMSFVFQQRWLFQNSFFFSCIAIIILINKDDCFKILFSFLVSRLLLVSTKMTVSKFFFFSCIAIIISISLLTLGNVYFDNDLFFLLYRKSTLKSKRKGN